MTAPPTVGLHVPGTTPLHRAPAPLKLAALAVLGVVVGTVRVPEVALGALAAAALAWAVARLPVRTLAPLRALGVVMLALGALQWWQRGPDAAVVVVGSVVAVVLAAAVVTSTTPLDDVVDTLLRGLRRLAHVPVLGRFVHPEPVALAVAVMLRTVPALAEVAASTRDAARARGVRSARAWLVPTVVRAVGRAVRTGEALHARGLLDAESRGTGTA